MAYNARLEIKVDDKLMLLVQGEAKGDAFGLEFEIPHAKKSIKAEWTKHDAVNFAARKDPQGIPFKITVDKKATRTLHRRDQRMYEAGNPQPWLLQENEEWVKLFQNLSRCSSVLPSINLDAASAVPQDRDAESWTSCVSGFSGAGAGIGGTIGAIGGALPGAITGGTIGGVIGTAIGVGYCSAAEADKE